jgi:toxin ParE1/3/4
MRQPELTEQAEADLDEAWEFIARDDQVAADRLIDSILEAARLHAQFPDSGRSRVEFGTSIRNFVVSPFVVFYKPIEDTIQVLRVLHGRRNIGRIMKKKGRGK